MTIQTPMITIGFHKGEPDFAVWGPLMNLDYAAMQQLRAMIPVAIATAERMWADEQARKPENRACQAIPTQDRWPLGAERV